MIGTIGGSPNLWLDAPVARRGALVKWTGRVLRYGSTMILCVTLNPCLDKTLEVDSWNPGDSVRGRSTCAIVGGKGNNVARALSRLGRRARPVTFLGGSVGEDCHIRLVRDDSFDPIVVPTKAETRVILTVRSNDGSEPTAFFDPDPEIEPDEAAALVSAVEDELNAGGIDAITLSGSSPCEATKGVYADLIALAKSRGTPIFLDTYGAALAAVWGFWPDFIQLNLREAAAHLGKASPSDSDLDRLLFGWSRRGVKIALITDGPRNVRIVVEGKKLLAIPPKIEPVNPVGAGDCLLAGLVDATLAGLDPCSRLRRGIACATAATLVWDAGAIDPDRVTELEKTIILD
jgi:1-phosphofructokinase family hexose kinase